jgi:tetratricopeptide (TPR) repeat protein
MPTRVLNSEEPAPEEVRAALERIAASEGFRASPQLVAFLSFVVGAALDGKGDKIKGYTIGVEALKRGANFDPQIDPIVRVEATRLRRAMERYYAGPGADSPVRIELARGSYVPMFSYHSAKPDMGSARPAVTATPSPSGNGMPTLLIQRFDALAAPTAKAVSAAALHEKLCDAFTRFDTINIVAGVPGGVPKPAHDYELMGSVEYRDDGSASMRFRLLDSGDGTVHWSRVFDNLRAVEDRAAIEDAIVTELAAVLIQPFGVIRAHSRRRHIASEAGDPRYRCLVEASESFRSFDPDQHKRARSCLERLIVLHPDFVSGFSYLAALYFREFQYGYEEQKSDSAVLDRALDMARRAIELKPESSRAYQMLFGVLFARREIAAAFAAGDKAMALNKYDTTVMSDYGGRLIMIGQVERGMAMLQKVGEFGTVRPSWHHFYMFLGSYLRGDLANIMHHANQITNEDYTLGLVARALAASIAGDRDRAIRSIQRLITVNPAWAMKPRGELDKFFPVADLADRLARDLEKAGLAVTDGGTAAR